MDDLTNRILAVGLALIWIFVVILAILLVWGAPDQSIERLGDLVGYLEDHNTNASKLIISFGGIILILLATLLIIFEIVPPEGDTLKVQRTDAGDAYISTEEVVLRLEDELQTMSQLSQAQATVIGRGKKAEVNLNLHVAPEANLAATVEEACNRARALLEERMSVSLARPPRAEVHYRELRVGPSPEAAAGAGTPSAPPQPSLQPRAAEPTHTPQDTPAHTMDTTHEAPPTSEQDRTPGS